MNGKNIQTLKPKRRADKVLQNGSRPSIFFVFDFREFENDSNAGGEFGISTLFSLVKKIRNL